MAKAKLIGPVNLAPILRMRIAAYCRVSTNSADQLHSYSAQISAYTKMIRENPAWELVEIFADEGISGTSAENRPEFQRMIQMCKLKKIDLIITKSVSRFGRNVPETLMYARMLKEMGIGIIFEKEGINTLSLGDEMLLNTFATLAQEESEAISKNQRFSVVRLMEKGEYIATNAPYGYRLVDKHLVIHEPEAIIVRSIFDLYLRGWSTTEIAKDLNQRKVPTKLGKGNWTSFTVKYMLSNERYIGDSLYQKTFRSTTVPFKAAKNRGQMDMFYAENTHPALLERDVYQRAQEILKERHEQYGRTTEYHRYPLTSRIRCSECGSFYRRKIQNGVVKWVCCQHEKDAKACPSFYYSEERIYDALVSMINKLRFSQPNILDQMVLKVETALHVYKHSNQAASTLSQSIAEINAKISALDQLRAKGYLSPDVYQSQVLTLKKQLQSIKLERESTFNTQLLTLSENLKQLKMFLGRIDVPLESMDETLLREVVESISIDKQDMMTVTVLGGFKFKELL